ncbi:MAG: hypothetical protein WBS14_18475, partial [Rhodomicrobium sp.]
LVAHGLEFGARPLNPQKEMLRPTAQMAAFGLMLAFQQRPGALQRNRLALPSHPRVGILLKDKERPRRRRFNRDLFRGPDV